jgi:hypothetical protein
LTLAQFVLNCGMNIYQELVGESSKLGERNDCGVKALSVVTGINYLECHKTLAKLGRKKGKGTLLSSMFKALGQFGFKVTEVNCPHRGMRSLGRNLPSKGSFLIFATGHFAGAKDGKIHDWSEGRCLRIRKFYQVSKIEDNTAPFVFKQEPVQKRQTFKRYKLVHSSGRVVAEYKRFPTKVVSVIKNNGRFRVWGRLVAGGEFKLVSAIAAEI